MVTYMVDIREYGSTLICFPDGRTIRSEDHQVEVEATRIQVNDQILMDDRHATIIVDREIWALMSIWRIEAGNILILRECRDSSCFCRIARVAVVIAMLSTTDITLSPSVQDEVGVLL